MLSPTRLSSLVLHPFISLPLAYKFVEDRAYSRSIFFGRIANEMQMRSVTQIKIQCHLLPDEPGCALKRCKSLFYLILPSLDYDINFCVPEIVADLNISYGRGLKAGVVKLKTSDPAISSRNASANLSGRLISLVN